MGNTKQEMFICYETYLIKTFHEWKMFYEHSLFIDKSEYPDFDTWWLDMRKSGVIEMSDETLLQGKENDERFIVFKHGIECVKTDIMLNYPFFYFLTTM